MKELIRTKVDKFDIENSLIKIEDIFEDWSNIILKEAKKDLFINGVNLKGFNNFCDGTYKIYCNNNFLGLGIVKNEFLKRDIVC